jgi:hypothetical protein
MDCKITENYFKEKARMTKDCSDTFCNKCPLWSKECGCIDLEEKFTGKAIDIVQKWSDENQRKTYRDVLLERFPNAEDPDFNDLCIKMLFKDYDCNKLDCSECWDEPCIETN